MKKFWMTMLYSVEAALITWGIASWIDVMCNNVAPYGELAVWNLFQIICG
jgi:hypothetical protein